MVQLPQLAFVLLAFGAVHRHRPSSKVRRLQRKESCVKHSGNCSEFESTNLIPRLKEAPRLACVVPACHGETYRTVRGARLLPSSSVIFRGYCKQVQSTCAPGSHRSRIGVGGPSRGSIALSFVVLSPTLGTHFSALVGWIHLWQRCFAPERN